jgi:hypothetical protein
MPEVDDKTLKDPEEPVTDPSPVEEPPIEEPEPDAEGNTGDEPEPAEGAESEEETERKPVPYDRFQEVIKERNEAKQAAQYHEQLAQEPEVAEAYRKVQARITGGLEGTAKSEEPDIVPLPEGWEEDDLTAVEQVLLRELRTVKKQVLTYEQKELASAQAEAGKQFTESIGTVEKELGRKLTKDEGQAIYTEAMIQLQGAQAQGKRLSVAEATIRGYRVIRDDLGAAVTKAKEKRDADLTEEKRRLAGANTGSRNGPVKQVQPGVLTPQEAVDRAFAKVCPNGLPD